MAEEANVARRMCKGVYRGGQRGIAGAKKSKQIKAKMKWINEQHDPWTQKSTEGGMSAR